MPIIHSKESPSRLTTSFFDGIEGLTTHEKIKTVLYRFGQGFLGKPIEVKSAKQPKPGDQNQPPDNPSPKLFP